MFELLRTGIAWKLDRKRHDDSWITVKRARHQFGINRLRRVMPNGLGRLPVKQLRRACIEQLQMIIELRHGAHGGARVAHRIGLVDRNGGRHAFDLVNRRFVHAVQELSCVGREGFHITALAFGKQCVKHQRRFSRAAGPGDHRHFTGTNVQIKVFEVVLARAANADDSLGHEWGSFLKRSNILDKAFADPWHGVKAPRRRRI